MFVRRFVVFNTQLGIYLGQGVNEPVWSLDKQDHSKYEGAMTFQNTEDFIHHIKGYQDIDKFVTYRLIEVIPDLPDGYASKEACKHRLLPTWE